MPHQRKHPVVAALLGPTAVGKSRIAAEIAPALNAEIISVDSMQVYRGMDIGTAKPPQKLQDKVPHHMIDVVEPSANYSVAEYQRHARRAVREIVGRGALPLLVGGTGLYFEAIVYDMRFPPGDIDDPLRREIEEWASCDPDGLREKLREVDPAFASTEGFNNIRRVIRAMEIYRRTGMPASELRSRRADQRPLLPYAGAVVHASREILNRLIETRVDHMVEKGLVDEVKRLSAQTGLSRTARQALGYKEVLDHLDRDTPLGETITNIKERSRRYAKRQLTWFRRIPGLRWFELQEKDLQDGGLGIATEILEYLEEEVLKRRAG
jgi:tRNA dimethylallyltransferase